MFIGYLVVFILLSLFYCWLMEYYRRGWAQLPVWEIPADFTPTTPISIVIPARNEADNIEHCLNSILAQNYPAHLLQILVIDDFSQDNTCEKVLALAAANLRLLRLCDVLDADTPQIAYKKKALEYAITQATGSLIVSTDADCIAENPNWLLYLASYYEVKKPVFIAAPVRFAPAISALERFQRLDFMGMMAITGAGIHKKRMYMCNGANLAYAKSVFMQVGGYEGITQHASGDDMFLLQKIVKLYPGKIGFLKNEKASITTRPLATLADFVQQRVRWASKSSGYSDIQMQVTLSLVWLFHFSLLISLLSVVFFGWIGLLLWLIQWTIKNIADFRLLQPATSFFKQPQAMRDFFLSSWLHWGYIVIIGFWSNVRKTYIWKGRKAR